MASHPSLDGGATRQPLRLAREVAPETVQDVASAHGGHSQTVAGLIRMDFLAVSTCDMSDLCWKCWVYSQWNSHLIGIMIMKTIGFRGLAYFQTHPYVWFMLSEDGLWKSLGSLFWFLWTPGIFFWFWKGRIRMRMYYYVILCHETSHGNRI